MLKLITTIFLIHFTLFAQDSFIFSYQSLIQNGILSDEKFNISPTMLHDIKDKKKLCTIKSKNSSNLNKLEFLYKNKNKLLECFLTQNRHIISFSNSINSTISTTTILTILPTKIYLHDSGDIFLID